MSTDALRERVKGLMPQAWEDLSRAVSFRSVADGSEPEECRADGRVDGRRVLRHRRAGRPRLRDRRREQGRLRPDPGPPGAPTVLLYFHHDVQPATNEGWESPPWELTARNDRWYGRGAADCKGSLAAHLAALRALGQEPPVTVKIVGEGSEEQGTGGLEAFVPENPDLLRADAILVCDTGNVAVGVPTLTASLRGMARVWVTVRTLQSAVHSGMFGGAAPDALAALIRMLDTLRDERGSTTIRGLDGTQKWSGAAYPTEQLARTPECSTASTSWVTTSRTRSGRDPRRPCSASTARPSSARLPPCPTRHVPASTCESHPAWMRRMRSRS